MSYSWSIDPVGRVRRRRHDEAHPLTPEERRQRIAARLARLTPRPTAAPPGTSSGPPPAALDRSLPLAERQAAYAAWAAERPWHLHPGSPGHMHAGGNRPHEHTSR